MPILVILRECLNVIKWNYHQERSDGWRLDLLKHLSRDKSSKTLFIDKVNEQEGCSSTWLVINCTVLLF